MKHVIDWDLLWTEERAHVQPDTLPGDLLDDMATVRVIERVLDAREQYGETLAVVNMPESAGKMTAQDIGNVARRVTASLTARVDQDQAAADEGVQLVELMSEYAADTLGDLVDAVRRENPDRAREVIAMIERATGGHWGDDLQ